MFIKGKLQSNATTKTSLTTLFLKSLQLIALYKTIQVIIPKNTAKASKEPLESVIINTKNAKTAPKIYNHKFNGFLSILLQNERFIIINPNVIRIDISTGKSIIINNNTITKRIFKNKQNNNSDNITYSCT